MLPAGTRQLAQQANSLLRALTCTLTTLLLLPSLTLAAQGPSITFISRDTIAPLQQCGGQLSDCSGPNCNTDGTNPNMQCQHTTACCPLSAQKWICGYCNSVAANFETQFLPQAGSVVTRSDASSAPAVLAALTRE